MSGAGQTARGGMRTEGALMAEYGYSYKCVRCAGCGRISFVYGGAVPKAVPHDRSRGQDTCGECGGKLYYTGACSMADGQTDREGAVDGGSESRVNRCNFCSWPSDEQTTDRPVFCKVCYQDVNGVVD